MPESPGRSYSSTVWLGERLGIKIRHRDSRAGDSIHVVKLER
jgi:hypothetical protein